METSTAYQSEGSSSWDERKLSDSVSSTHLADIPTTNAMVVQDSSPLPRHGEDAAHRAREILDSLKVRRETLLQTMRAACPASHGSTDVSVSSLSSSTRRSLQEVTVKSSRLKGCCFDGTESQLLTAHMAKVLQERRERLSRILAGMDPDDASVGPSTAVKDDARDASPTEKETTDTDIDDDMDGHPANEASRFVHDLESSWLSDDDTGDDTDGAIFTAMPPTLQEIEDALSSTDNEIGGEFTNEASDDRETSVAAEEVEDRRCATDLIESSCDENDGSTTGGFEPIASPVGSHGSHLSPIRRANSFGDSTGGLERGDSHSIRAALSFDNLFQDSKQVHMTPSHQFSAESQRFAPALSAREPLISEFSPPGGRVEAPESPKVKEQESDRLHAALTDPTVSSCTPDSLDLNRQAEEIQEEVSNEAKALLNFFPPATPVSTGDRWKLSKVTTVTDEIEDDSSKSGTALSSSSTLTTREERMGYLHNLVALQVTRPVPRYPPDEVPPSSLPVDVGRGKRGSIGEDRVPSPHPGVFMVGKRDGRVPNGTATASPNLLVDEEDRSLSMISDTSSFDGTYDDTVTSGYLSLGASERLSSLLGDDCTDLSILMSTNASFDESLEDGASVELLLRSSPGNPALAVETRREPTTEASRGISILSPAITSSVTPLESCLLSSSGASRETRVTSVKRVAFAEVPPTLGSPIRQYRKPHVLFVAEEVADSLCGTYGGLYSILLASDYGTKTHKGTDATSSGNAAHSRTSSKALKRSAGIQFLRLNPDFRCGAQGSTYDICIQSGFDVTTPWQWTKRRKYLPVKGGLFDVAKKSGLSKELMHSRAPLIVKTKPLSLCREEDTEVLPEDVSDYECGATGNLYLAFESGGGDYVSKGSLYYLATRSGFKVCQ